MGCPVPDVTPNLDKLAKQSMRFGLGHVTVAVCQPSRQCMMTGRYPHNMGAPGFDPIRPDVTTLTERTHQAGYLNGIFGKETHLAPKEKFFWDVFKPASEMVKGRSPQRYYDEATAFFARAKSEKKPFFLMANSHDPHRPFAGSADELNRWKEHLRVTRTYKAEEVVAPEFLPDLPEMRSELAEYYTSVHRGDESLGNVLRALDEAGFADNTLVMYLSDNGMAFPFAKANCYLTSTHTPWLVRWPGVTKAGTVDEKHFVNGVDFTPTILEALGLEPIEGLDGRSFLSILKGGTQANRDQVYTLFNGDEDTAPENMRCMQDKHFGYIWNPWSDGKNKFKTNYMMGPGYEAWKASKDPSIAARLELFLHRVPEELYDFEHDPWAKKNLIADPVHKGMRDDMRKRLLAEMDRSKDPLTEGLRALAEKSK